ncbi:MAG: outer membrane protein assembly factor BamA, partial [Pseudomonadota bacterium]
QVSLGENPEDVFITITIDEGPVYTLGNVRLGGDFAVPRDDLLAALTVASGDTFSRREVSASQEAIGDRLGEDGYAFPDITITTQEHEAGRKVDLNFIVTSGRRFYVRRIQFSGNIGNQDTVYRREMRIVEGSLFSPTLIRRSRERLNRLPFVDSVGVRSERVPGREDMLDVVVTINEGGPGTFTASVGYGSNGFQFALNLDLHSAFGSGNNVKLGFSRSETTERINVSYREPYYTLDGISRTLSADFKRTDTENTETTAEWIANSWGLGAVYGIPRSEFATLRLGWGYDSIQIDETDQTSTEIRDFLATNGDRFAGLNLTLGYTHDTRDRVVFPNAGTIHRITLKGGAPNHDYPYYKLGYGFDTYRPLFGETVLSFGLKADYGEGYGDDFTTLPFFDRFYAGGPDSVRGFRNSSLGPRDSQGDAAGGDVGLEATLALLFPPPNFSGADEPIGPRRTRMSLFIDAGNVFTDADSFEASELRLTYGVGFTWLSPIGPLKFSLARPFDDEPDDELEAFQFNISF